MFDGVGNFFWQQTATLEAVQINQNRKKGTPLTTPQELNPFSRKENAKEKITISGKMAWDILKAKTTGEKEL